MRQHFVDEALRSNTTPPPLDEELLLLKLSLGYNLDSSHFQRVTGSLKFHSTVQMLTRKESLAGSSSHHSVWGKFFGDVDETLEVVLSWIWHHCSYERISAHKSINGDLICQCDSAGPASRRQVIKEEVRIAPAVHQKSATEYVWFKLDSGLNGHGEAYAIALRPAATSGSSDEWTGASSVTGVYLLVKISPRITRLTVVKKFEVGVGVPQWVVNLYLTVGCSLVSQAQDRFRRVDKEVDKEMRDAIAAQITGFSIGIPSTEHCKYDKCKNIAKDFENTHGQHTQEATILR